MLGKVITEEWSGEYRAVEIRVCSSGVPAEGQICARADELPPKKHLDVTDIPIKKPNGAFPYIEKDGHWLTPIEKPFYDALRETGAISPSSPGFMGSAPDTGPTS